MQAREPERPRRITKRADTGKDQLLRIRKNALVPRHNGILTESGQRRKKRKKISHAIINNCDHLQNPLCRRDSVRIRRICSQRLAQRSGKRFKHAFQNMVAVHS